MRFVSLSRLNLPEAREATVLPWGVALAEHESGAAVVVGEHQGTRSAYIGFPLLRTELPLRVAFPILINNLVQWLAAGPGRGEGLQVRAGETVPLELPAGLREVTVTGPDGRARRVRPEGRTLFYADTEHRGIYQVAGGDFRRDFAVNLLSREESATAPQDRILLGRRPILAGEGYTRTARELWRWLVLLGIVVLAIEWWVYHRRV
jgi:Ca-activated chloride channel family protein